MMKNFLMAEIFLKKLAICSQFRPHESMRKKCFLLACCLCTGAFAVPSVFGGEPTKEELLEIMREAHKKGLWKPNVSLASQKDGENDPVTDAFERSNFLWDWIAIGILNTCRSDKIISLPQQYLKQVEKILLQKDGKGLLGTEIFSKDPVLEIIKRDVAQYMERCCHDGFLDKDEIPNLDAFLVFFHEKLSPFIGDKGRNFTETVDAFGNALLDFGNTVQDIKSAFEKKSEGEPDLKVFLSLMEAFKKKKEALLRIGDQPHPCYKQTTFDYNDSIKNFLKRIEASEWIKKLNAVRRTASFIRSQEGDLKKIPNDFNIFGLDKKYVKYSNPFKDTDIDREVGSCIREALKPYTEKFTDAYKKVGTDMEDWLRCALQDVNDLSINAWYPHTGFDFEPVMKRFDEVVAMYDINNAIFRETPKLDLFPRTEAFRLLQDNAISLLPEAVKSISDACGARFENTVMKHCQSIVTTLRALLSHYFSLIITIRKIESEELAMPRAEAKEIVAHWLLEKDKLQQAFTVAEGGFYNTFFGGKKRISWGNFEPTVGDGFRKIECFDTLMFRLKKWKLLPDAKQPQKGKKEEAEKNNISENTIVEDQKEPDTVIVAPKDTKLTNEKEPAKRTRRAKSNE